MDHYGTDALLLRPVVLNLAEDGKIPAGIVLKAPIYDSDGRISKYANTICGPYNNVLNKFVASDGLSISTKTGGGVYADIADHCGNYKTGVVISKVPYKGLQLENVQATINVTTDVAPTHVSSCETMFEQLEAPIGGDAVSNAKISHTAVASIQSSIQLAFSDTEQP